MDKNVVALQTEIGRLVKALAVREDQLKLAVAEAQRLGQAGQQVEQEKMTAITNLLALLLEHHAGEADISIPLAVELGNGKTVYGIRSTPSRDAQGQSVMRLQVVDGEGNLLGNDGPQTSPPPEPGPQNIEPWEVVRARMMAES